MNSEHSAMELKPLDIVIALCLGQVKPRSSHEEDKLPLYTVRDMAEFTGAAVGSVAASQNRLLALGLIAEVPDFTSTKPTSMLSLNRRAIAEFLLYGVRYYSLAERHGVGIGSGTAWSCPVLRSPVLPPELPVVWENPQGSQRGELLRPLHAAVIPVSMKSPVLYRQFALIDALRIGQARETKIARDLLKDSLGVTTSE